MAGLTRRIFLCEGIVHGRSRSGSCARNVKQNKREKKAKKIELKQIDHKSSAQLIDQHFTHLDGKHETHRLILCTDEELPLHWRGVEVWNSLSPLAFLEVALKNVVRFLVP